MSKVIRKNGIVVLRGDNPLKMKTDTFEPGTEYRSIELSCVGGDKQILVYGVVFNGERFAKLFKYIK
jgi:hypothetical protein